MAAKQDIAPRTQRLAALGAVALLAAGTALAFGRVFVGHATTLRLLAAALASVALAAAFERRSLLLATVVSAAGLLVAIGWFVFPATLWAGLPTRETLHAIVDALGRVGHDARVQVAPSDPLRPLLLAGLTAVWTASFSAHALAIRAGSPLLAVLPPIALVGFADTVLEDGARPLYAVLLLGSALLVVFTDGLRRIRQWGPVWSSPGRRRLSSVAGRGARRVGVTAVVAALAFPGVLPGFRDDPLLDFSTTGTEGTHLDPLVAIRSNLVRDQAVPLYRVTSTDSLGGTFASYWRAYALDTFDGDRWTSSDTSGAKGVLMSAHTLLEPDVDPPDAAVRTVRQHVELLQEQQDTALPLAYPAVQIDAPTTQIRYDDDLGTVTIPGQLPAEASYAVESNVVIPTPADLDPLIPSAPSPRYVHLPPSLPIEIRQIAERWAASATRPDPYRRILAIMDHFTSPNSPFVYSTEVDTRDDADALLNFLTRSHRGFCQQYAAAMAVLVRALGYPARVAVGYRTGTASGDAFLVTTHDAHAWVEVYFPGYGWLPFEPTPRRPNPISHIVGSYLNPAASISDPGSGAGETSGGSRGDAATPSQEGIGGCIIDGRRVPGPICTEPDKPGRLGGRNVAGTTLRFDRPDDGYGVPLRLVFGGVLALALVLLVLIPAVKWAIRLRLAHRRGTPTETVLAAFRLFDGEAADVGFGRLPGETLTEYRRRLSERVPFSDGHLARLTSAVTLAAYATDRVDEAAAREALRDARVAIRDVRRRAGLTRRILGVYRPGV
jgi:transglutaminase-like putative cysteine protease